jgi:hypothetical protein
MTTFTLKINSTEIVDRVETLDENNVATVSGKVSKIHWELSGVDGDKQISHVGVADVSVEVEDISSIDSKELTEALEAALGEEALRAEKEKIEEQLNPAEVK